MNELLISLAYNIAGLFAFAIVYERLWLKKEPRKTMGYKITSGLILGAIVYLVFIGNILLFSSGNSVTLKIVLFPLLLIISAVILFMGVLFPAKTQSQPGKTEMAKDAERNNFNNLLEKKNAEILSLYDEYQEVKEKFALINSTLIAAKEKEFSKFTVLINMSDEIRRPLNSIIGFADLMKEQELTDDCRQKYIGIIKKSAVNMLNITNDLIDIAKVETEQMEVIVSTFNINEQIEFIYSSLNPFVEGKGMQLRFKNALPTEAAFIKTDCGKIHEIMVKLIFYAIKYSEKGTIDFGYRLNKDGDRSELEFFVTDTGFDIPQNIREAIFHSCEKDEIIGKRDVLAAGLGFALSKAYVEMLGSTIQVRCEEEKGFTFYFSIPYDSRVQENVKIDAASKENQKGDRARFVTQDDEMSEMLRTIALKILNTY